MSEDQPTQQFDQPPYDPDKDVEKEKGTVMYPWTKKVGKTRIPLWVWVLVVLLALFIWVVYEWFGLWILKINMSKRSPQFAKSITYDMLDKWPILLIGEGILKIDEVDTLIEYFYRKGDDSFGLWIKAITERGDALYIAMQLSYLGYKIDKDKIEVCLVAINKIDDRKISDILIDAIANQFDEVEHEFCFQIFDQLIRHKNKDVRENTAKSFVCLLYHVDYERFVQATLYLNLQEPIDIRYKKDQELDFFEFNKLDKKHKILFINKRKAAAKQLEGQPNE